MTMAMGMVMHMLVLTLAKMLLPMLMCLTVFPHVSPTLGSQRLYLQRELAGGGKGEGGVTTVLKADDTPNSVCFVSISLLNRGALAIHLRTKHACDELSPKFS
jgi:hypothetical protein